MRLNPVTKFKKYRMLRNSNLIFLGCNYSNKKVKVHFDALKEKWEKEWPVRVVLIDKEKAKGTRDLWNEINQKIENASLAIFDVSAFRPNVVLELGYALAIKDEESIVITFDERKKGKEGKKPEWLLSDISHRHRVTYKELTYLDQQLEAHLSKVPSKERFEELKHFFSQDHSTAAEKYIAASLQVLKKLRDEGNKSDQQIGKLIQGQSLRIKTLLSALKKHKLAKRTQGPNGRWYLLDNE